MLRQCRGCEAEFDVLVYAHTHKPSIDFDERGRMLLNPGETSGWTYRQPTVAILETRPIQAEIVPLRPVVAAPSPASAPG
jgi:hypothetical protein